MVDSDDDKATEEPTTLPLWQEIQKRTFTNWVNLRIAPSFINDLFADMSDGLQLINLIEVLTERRLGRRNKRIEHVNQRLDNVAIALEFLQDKEGINLTNIGPADIVERNPKLILGLMWILFRHYTIARALPALPSDLTSGKSNDKARLLQWIRNKLPVTFPVSNLTSDWNDGFALAALVEGCVDKLDVGWQSWDPRQPLENTKKAMNLAKEYLGIENMIAPEDLISSDVDEISVMAYLTNFPLVVENRKTKGSLSQVDRHPIAGIRSAFNVNVPNVNHRPNVQISKVGDGADSSGIVSDIETTQTNNPHVYDVSYVPPVPGTYEIMLTVSENGDESRRPDSVVKVEAVEGPGLKGLNTHPFVGEAQHLRIYNANPTDTIRVEVIGPESARIAVPVAWNPATREFEGVFRPQRTGHYSVNVLSNNRNIRGSPFPTRVQDINPPEFWGRGLQKSLRAGEPGTIQASYPEHFNPIDAKNFLENAKVKVTNTQTEASVPVTEKMEGNTKTFTYVPEDICPHEVSTIFNDNVIDKYLVNAQYPSAQSRAFGPGTKTGMAKHKSLFLVKPNNNEDYDLSFEGPSVEVKKIDLVDGSSLVEYTPSTSGKYYVNVTDTHGQNVKDSPFAVEIKDEVQGFYPDKVKISNLPEIVRVNEVVEFSVDGRPAHSLVAHPELLVYDPEGEKIETRVQQRTDGTSRCSFCPRVVGHHNAFVTFDGVSVAQCPIRVTCVDPDKITYSGPGIDSPAYCSPKQTHFVIDAKQAGPGSVEVEMVDSDDENVDVEVMDEQDGSYTVRYKAAKPGAYKIKVVFAGYTLPKFEINVQQPADVSGTRVQGLDNEKTDASKCIATGDGLVAAILGERANFKIDTSKAGVGNLIITIEGPTEVDTFLDETKTSAQGGFITYVPGDYHLSIQYGPDDKKSAHIPGSPFKITADYPVDLKAIAIRNDTGDEIQNVAKGVEYSFIVDATKCAKGEISPNTSALRSTDIVKISEIEPRLWKVGYTLNDPANRIVPIDLLYDGKPLPTGRMVKVVNYLPENLVVQEITRESDASLETQITIETRKVGKIDNLTAVVKNVYNGEQESAKVRETQPGIYSVVTEPKMPGLYEVTFFADGHPLHTAPITFTAVCKGDAKNCDILSVPHEYVVNNPNNVLVAHSGENNVFNVIDKLGNNDLDVNVFSTNAKEILPSASQEKLAIVQYIPLREGRYETSLHINCQPIKDGNITFDAQTHSNNGVGELSEFVLEWDPSYNDKELNAFVLDPDNQIHQVAATLYEENKLVVSSPVSKNGRYVAFCFVGDVVKPITIFEKTPKPASTPESIIRVDQHNTTESVDFAESIHSKKENEKKPWAYGPGLQYAYVGQEAEFHVVCPKRGQVRVHVTGPKDVLLKMKQKEENSCLVKWIPKEPGTYDVKIFVDSDETVVDGSPFQVVVLPDQIRRVSLVEPPEVPFNCGKNVDVEQISVMVKDPEGIVTCCRVRNLDDKTIGISFKPTKVGKYNFTILEKGHELPRSPITLQIGKADLPNEKKVFVYGQGIKEAYSDNENFFIIDYTAAGYGGVSVFIDGPSDAPVAFQRIEARVIKVQYTPQKTGNYTITVGFNEKTIPDGVFNIKCKKSSERRKTRTIVHTDIASHDLPCAPNEMKFYIPNTKTDLLQATIISPSGQEHIVPLIYRGNDSYSLVFDPNESGSTTVHLTENGEDVSDSPFYINANPETAKDANTVRIVGNGLQFAQVNVPQKFMIYSTTDETDVVNVVIDGPDKPQTKLKDMRDGSVYCEYTLAQPGHYFISIFFNGKPVRPLPYCVYAHPSKPEKKKRIIKELGRIRREGSKVQTSDVAEITGAGLKAAVTGEPAFFDIIPKDKSDLKYTVEFFGSSKVQIKNKKSEDKIMCQYTAFKPGTYTLNIKHRGVPVANAPYTINVEGREIIRSEGYDSSQIQTREKNTVTQKPETKEHSLKYAENEISIPVESPPPLAPPVKGQIYIDGEGIKQFVPGKPSMFRIYNVGNVTLFFGVITESGPCQQCSLNNCGDGSFLVTYVINERTPGYIYIRYGDKDLPGSPFVTFPSAGKS